MPHSLSRMQWRYQRHLYSMWCFHAKICSCNSAELLFLCSSLLWQWPICLFSMLCSVLNMSLLWYVLCYLLCQSVQNTDSQPYLHMYASLLWNRCWYMPNVFQQMLWMFCHLYELHFVSRFENSFWKHMFVCRKLLWWCSQWKLSSMWRFMQTVCIIGHSMHWLLYEYEPIFEQSAMHMQLWLLQRFHECELSAMSILLSELFFAYRLFGLFSRFVQNDGWNDVPMYARLLRQWRICSLSQLFSRL